MIFTADNPDLHFLFDHGQQTASPLPMVFDSNGNFCWEINNFLTKFGGGANSYGARPLSKTVVSHAITMNVFQRYLDHTHKNIREVDDKLLYSFVEDLKKAEKANNTTIKRTVRRILSLIEHVQSESPSLALLSLDYTAKGFNVYASEDYAGRGTRRTRFLSHSSIDDMRDTPVAPVEYIKQAEIDAWHEAIFEYTTNDYIIERWYAYTALLEYTGSRLDEVINIPASAVIDAYNNNSPLKNIPVLKGSSKGFHRSVLIPRSELQEIYKFVIATHARFPNAKMHDRIFVDSDSGEIMSRETFSSYYRKVLNSSKNAELLAKVSNHNFRHRYFTLLVARNIAILSKKSRANILDVAMSAGRSDSLHANKSTLARYVHLSTDPEIQEILKKGTESEEVSSAKLAHIAKLKQAYNNGAPAEETLDAIFKLL